MAAALYADDGFYRAAGGPAHAFRTAAHASRLWATAIHELGRRIDDSLANPQDFAVVDVGAGGGELLANLSELAPDRWTLTGVERAPRPASLPPRVRWQREVSPGTTGLLIAAELLDVVPVDVVELTDSGAFLVEVTVDGDEDLDGMVTGRDARWLSKWWPLAEVGDRAEVGWPRDDMWRSLTGSLVRGACVAIDYAAVPGRDAAGTLTAFRNGRQVAPVPDGSCDVTAHVLFESLRGPDDCLMSQRSALQQLGLSGRRPDYAGDPSGYLAALTTAGEAAELLDPGGLGGFTWLVHSAGIACPVGIDVRSVGSGDAGRIAPCPAS